jgi:uncharacterized spore protein YtfJ
MDRNSESLFFSPMASHKEGIKLMERLTDVGQPGAVYSDPVTVDGHTVITASEVTVGLGYGFGGGGEATGEAEGEPGGYGGGGGGGGAGARPVAAIHVSADGVSVEPIVDVTKLALAFFTLMGSIFLMRARMRKGAR